MLENDLVPIFSHSRSGRLQARDRACCIVRLEKFSRLIFRFLPSYSLNSVFSMNEKSYLFYHCAHQYESVFSEIWIFIPVSCSQSCHQSLVNHVQESRLRRSSVRLNRSVNQRRQSPTLANVIREGAPCTHTQQTRMWVVLNKQPKR